jgi:hypothetical protein
MHDELEYTIIFQNFLCGINNVHCTLAEILFGWDQGGCRILIEREGEGIIGL